MDTLNNYISRLGEILQRGDAREETYYPALETLIKALAEHLDQKQMDKIYKSTYLDLLLRSRSGISRSTDTPPQTLNLDSLTKM